MDDCFNILLQEQIHSKQYEVKKKFSQKQITQQATGREEDISYQLDEKSLPLHDVLDHFVFPHFSTAYLRRRLPYIIKDDSSEGL